MEEEFKLGPIPVNPEEAEVAEKVRDALAQWAEDKEHLERETALYHVLRRERNYQILQAAAMLTMRYTDLETAISNASWMLKKIEEQDK